MIIVDFKDENYKRVTGLWQWDYGQVLRIQGLNLPKAVEIHFSLQESGGQSVTRIGMTKDGVTDVVIPDSLLENEESLGDYDIFAFIYLTDDTSGQTEYKICMPVKARPKPEAFDKPEDGEIFREAITAVRESAERAESAEQKAAQHALETAGDKTEVERLATQVRQDKTVVEQTAQEFASTASQAVQSVNTAKTKGVNAINTAKTNAVKEVQTEGTTQTGNVTAEGAKQVQAVQAKGQQILDSITEIQVNNPATTYELQPNVQVVWNEVAELNLTLAPEKQNAINIYPFWFTSGATPTRVTLPATIILDGFVTKPNKKYCCQIEQNVMFWKEFDVV